ncbi:unnamed protein product [Onchocerca flexuosa]|uniref:Myotubularin phosphatase domain-containing protein n=1 Tax=Onchocerca flexuosa TaxID=387005 RepID=A0A183H593_9BILA|nr:unnamed protein product [Onchocerca flexuosa]
MFQTILSGSGLLILKEDVIVYSPPLGKNIAVSDNSSSNSKVVVIAPQIEHPESWSMPAASEAIPIRVPAGTQRGEDGFVSCGVIDNDSFPLESVEDPPYFLDMSHYSQSVEDDNGPSAATIFAQHAKISETLPVGALPGESLESTMDTGSGTVYITNYRIVILDRVKNAVAIIPLLSVDTVEFWSGDPYGIQITCKFGRICRLRCASEVQVELHKRLQKVTYNIATNDIFAWQFARAAKAQLPGWLRFHSETGDSECSAQKEFMRLNYNPRSWRVSEANTDYSLCATYPKSVIVPKDITDDELRRACAARNNARFPAAVWCCAKNESVLLRSSQPCCGIFNYRFPLDEKLLECARKAVNGRPSSRKLLIVDCRSYTAALANRVVKGGGAESEGLFDG